MHEPIKCLIPWLESIPMSRMSQYWEQISQVIHQLDRGKNSGHALLLRFLSHLLWRTDATQLLSAEDWRFMIGESSATIGFIDSILVGIWVLHGTSMLQNTMVYFSHSHYFYELDLALLQLSAANVEDFFPDMVTSYSDIQQLISYIETGTGEVHEKVVKLGPLFFRRLIHLILYCNFSTSVTASDKELEELLTFRMIQNLCTGAKRYGQIRESLPKHLKDHPKIDQILQKIATQQGNNIVIKEEYWVYFDPFYYISSDDASKSANNAEFIMKKGPNMVDTIIGAIQSFEPSAFSVKIAANMVKPLTPIISSVFTLFMNDDKNIDQIVVYACLKLIQQFQRLLGYTLDEEMLEKLHALKEKVPAVKNTVNRLTGSVEVASSTAANDQKAKMASARARFEEFKKKNDAKLAAALELNRHESEEVEADPCSLCMEPLISDYGLVAHVQSSKVLSKQMENPDDCVYLEQLRGMNLSSCGHKMHMSCFAKFCQSK